MSAEQVIRVVTVAGRRLARARLRDLLAQAPDVRVVAEAGGEAREAHHRVARERPDVVVILDDALDAVALTRALVGRLPEVPAVLVMTGNDARARGALWAGAVGLVGEHAGAGHVAAAVRMVAAGYSVLTPNAHNGGTPSWRARRANGNGGLPGNLTPREIDVLHLVVRGHSNAEISAALSLSENTVKSHVQRVLTKLELRNRVSAVIFAYEMGLVTTGVAGAPEELPAGAPGRAPAETVPPRAQPRFNDRRLRGRGVVDSKRIDSKRADGKRADGNGRAAGPHNIEVPPSATR